MVMRKSGLWQSISRHKGHNKYNIGLVINFDLH